MSILAGPAPSGMIFDEWDINSVSPYLAGPNNDSMVLIMDSENAEVMVT